jgi:hypothetical protein
MSSGGQFVVSPDTPFDTAFSDVMVRGARTFDEVHFTGAAKTVERVMCTNQQFPLDRNMAFRQESRL